MSAWPSDALGVLPLDVYRVIFAALDYATLRDACRTLNKTLAALARQVLITRRYAPHRHAAPSLRWGLLAQDYARWHALIACKNARACLNEPGARCTDCDAHVSHACALPLGGFLLAIYARGCLDNTRRLLLAVFDAHATLQRVLPLHLGSTYLAYHPWHVMLMRAHNRCVYILVEQQHMDAVSQPILLCYTHDAPLRISVLPCARTSDVPCDGPARWTRLILESCAVAPPQLVLCCRGANTGYMDQIVMLEMDLHDMRVRRTLTLEMPTETNLAQYAAHAAPWPRTGQYSGVRRHFHVDPCGRYVFFSQQVGAHAALLLFEPLHGTLLAYVALEPLMCGTQITTLCTAEPHSRVYLSQLSPLCTVSVSLEDFIVSSCVPCISPVLDAVVEPLLLDDGYMLFCSPTSVVKIPLLLQ